MKKVLSIDGLKLIASFMIVAIHVYPFASFNPDVDYIITRVLFRIAVPFFLMVTGYFVLPKALQDRTKLITYSKKILILYLLSIFIYLPIHLYNGTFSSLSWTSILKEIFFEGTFYHLWYFPALILGLWITYFLVKRFSFTFSAICVFLLYFVGLFGDSYYGLIQNAFFSSFYQFLFRWFDYTRNGIFYVPIFLFIGYFISKYQKKYSCTSNIIFFFISFILMGMEGWVLYFYQVPRHTSMYLFLIPASYFLFTFASRKEQSSDKTLRSMSTNIYIWHPFFIVLCHFASDFFLFSFLKNSLCQYFTVLLLTCFFAYFLSIFLRKKTFK